MIRRGCFFNLFLYSTAVLLVLTAAAKLYSATGTARILSATDPLIHLAYGKIMVVAGFVEAAVAGYLLIGRNATAKVWLVLWLGSNFMMYRIANEVLRIKLCPCLGTVGSALPFSRAQVDFLLTILVLYLISGSIIILVSARGNRSQSASAVELTGPHAEAQPLAPEAHKSLDFRA